MASTFCPETIIHQHMGPTEQRMPARDKKASESQIRCGKKSFSIHLAFTLSVFQDGY